MMGGNRRSLQGVGPSMGPRRNNVTDRQFSITTGAWMVAGGYLLMESDKHAQRAVTTIDRANTVHANRNIVIVHVIDSLVHRLGGSHSISLRTIVLRKG